MLNPATPFRVALRERNMRLLLTSLAASQAGDWLYNVALLALVYERTGSSMWVGITTAARLLPEVALGPFGGMLADRVDRRRLMLGSDGVRAAAMFALAVVAVVDGPVVLLPALAALCTAAGSAYVPCVLGTMPRLVDADELPAANAARVSLTHLCVVAGPLVGAGVLLLGTPAAAFAVNGITFLVGGAIVAILPREALRVPAGAGAYDDQRPTLRSDLAAGWDALRGYADALPLVGANVLASAVYGALTVLFVLAGHRLDLGGGGYGCLLAAFGGGGVLAAGLAHRAAACDDPRRVLVGAVAAIGAPLPVFALAGWLPGALVLAAIVGAGSLVTEVVADTCLQRSLDEAVFARAYGLALPACLAGIAAGALLAPVCVALAGLDGTLIGLGAVVVMYGVLLVARPTLRREVALAQA